MKLKDCLEIGRDCGLETVGEAILNIELHSISLFAYSEIKNELNELYEATKDISYDTTIGEILNENQV